MQRILLVENQLDLQEELGDVLRYEGFEIEATADLDTAKTMLSQRKIRLVLCSMLMPSKDGIELLRFMRSQSQYDNIPFIFLTGLVQIDLLREAMEAGADDYLLKPIRSRDLIRAVRTRIQRVEAIEAAGYKKFTQQRQVLLHHFPHEVFTPLNVSLNVSKLMKKRRHELAPHELDMWAHMLINNNTRLFHLLENQLMYLELHLSDITQRATSQCLDLKPEVERVALERAQSYKRENDLQLHLEDVEYPIRVKHCQIIVRSLVDNAFKFSEAGNPVVVSLQKKQNGLYFEVTDTGRGMPREEIERINAFKQFNRQQHEQQGLGLGLELCQKLVQALEGHLHIESVEGRYTHVQVSFK